MITFNPQKLQDVIAGYKQYFPTHIADEIYKWKAVKKFQDVWDIDAPNFGAMFIEATSLHDNLLTSRNHFVRSMLKEMWDAEPETVRRMFRDLFDETMPLEGRINRFRAESDRIRQDHWPEKMHYQDINAISTYLWSRYPEKYYIYKYSEVKVTTKVLESSYVVRRGADALGYVQAVEFFNILRTAVQDDSGIRPMLNSVLTSDCYKDENLNCVVVDLDFYVSRFWEETTPVIPVAQKDVKYWMYSPGENARKWNDCTSEGVMCLGWDELGDLQDYESRETMREQMRQEYGLDGSYMNASLATWEFANEIQVGDIVFAKRGRTTIVGRGVVESEYFYDEKRDEYHSLRKVRWTEIGNWETQQFQAMKTLTVLNENISLFEDDYQKYLRRFNASEVHNGYFSIDKKGRAVNSETKGKSDISDDISAYDLILKNKERLLSFDEPTRFIFSHSALREGWDNPNVFQICTLRHAASAIAKRQEVGRGLRICVDQNGNRMDKEELGEEMVQDINKLTVIANESYKTFVDDLQKETREALRDRPTKATLDFFLGKGISLESFGI